MKGTEQMQLTFVQKAMIESLKESPKTIVQMEQSLNKSKQTVRNNLIGLEAAGYVERDYTRQPHLFSYKEVRESPIDSGETIDQSKVDAIKAALLKPTAQQKAQLRFQVFQDYPKESWEGIAKTMEMFVVAVRQLNDEGQLVTTLDPKDLT